MPLPAALRSPLLHTSLALLLLGGAVAVRAIPPSNEAPKPKEDAVSAIREPMQLLWSGGALRLHELDALVPEDRRRGWMLARRAASELADCPDTSEWLTTSEGQKAERFVAQLTAGPAEEAFCALAFYFQLARRTSWEPGVFGGSQDAERLGALLLVWLERWAEKSVEDPLLREPALGTFLVYGLVMDSAASGNAFSSSEDSRERARAAMRQLVGESGRHMSAFGAGVAARYPRAFAALTSGEGGLADLAREARLWFPQLDGDCGG